MIPGLLAAIAVFSYLLGGLNGAIIASKYVFHRDVRDYGSGNAGLTNFYRTFGAPGLAIVIGTDVLKTVIAVVAGGSSWARRARRPRGRCLRAFVSCSATSIRCFTVFAAARACSAPRRCC